jgi:hypothetical protein
MDHSAGWLQNGFYRDRTDNAWLQVSMAETVSDALQKLTRDKETLGVMQAMDRSNWRTFDKKAGHIC